MRWQRGEVSVQEVLGVFFSTLFGGLLIYYTIQAVSEDKNVNLLAGVLPALGLGGLAIWMVGNFKKH